MLCYASSSCVQTSGAGGGLAVHRAQPLSASPDVFVGCPRGGIRPDSPFRPRGTRRTAPGTPCKRVAGSFPQEPFFLAPAGGGQEEAKSGNPPHPWPLRADSAPSRDQPTETSGDPTFIVCVRSLPARPRPVSLPCPARRTSSESMVVRCRDATASSSSIGRLFVRRHGCHVSHRQDSTCLLPVSIPNDTEDSDHQTQDGSTSATTR